jgi:hypothetical protein
VIGRLTEGDPATVFRRGVLALAGLGLLGTTVELVFLRHWTSLTQLVVWPGVVALAIGLWLVVRAPTARRVERARILALVVLVIAATGVALHVHANLDAGPLDRRYATTWDTLGSVEQWWLAITGGVGPAPVLAPGALAEIGLTLLLGTFAHPALATRGRQG